MYSLERFEGGVKWAKLKFSETYYQSDIVELGTTEWILLNLEREVEVTKVVVINRYSYLEDGLVVLMLCIELTRGGVN